MEGEFESPLQANLPNIMPEETKIAYFQMILPKQWKSEKIKPICLHLAGTGDHVNNDINALKVLYKILIVFFFLYQNT
jgi:hypothetical protein